jgi:hypothetical protein
MTGTWTALSPPVRFMLTPVARFAPAFPRQAALHSPGLHGSFECFRAASYVCGPATAAIRRSALDGSGLWCKITSSCNSRARVHANRGTSALRMMSGGASPSSGPSSQDGLERAREALAEIIAERKGQSRGGFTRSSASPGTRAPAAPGAAAQGTLGASSNRSSRGVSKNGGGKGGISSVSRGTETARGSATASLPTNQTKTRGSKAESGVASQPAVSRRRAGKKKFSARVPSNFSEPYAALVEAVAQGKEPPLLAFRLLLKKLANSAAIGYEWPDMQRGIHILSSLLYSYFI